MAEKERYLSIPLSISRRKDLSPGEKLCIGAVWLLQGKQACVQSSFAEIGALAGLSKIHTMRALRGLSQSEEVIIVGAGERKRGLFSVPALTRINTRRKWFEDRRAEQHKEAEAKGKVATMQQPNLVSR